MEPELKTLRTSINKAFLREAAERSSFDRFKTALGRLLEQIGSAQQKDEHEEHFKNFLEPFFRETGFEDYYINTSGRIDLAIHNGAKVRDPVGVLIEVKRPSNKAEMIAAGQFNRKAMHEAVLYYLEQRMEENNADLKHVVITNMREWFVFDAQEIERCFYRPSALRKAYKSWKADRKVSSNKDFMYGEIARFMEDQASVLHGTHFNLHEAARLLKAKEGSGHEKKLIPLFKFFTPVYLLKEPFANDSNRLNREFYRELLYILGLEETKEGSARYIRRTAEENRRPGSLIENTIRILDSEDHLSTVSEPEVHYGDDRNDRLFHVAMELNITWMNRVLFLKLLEAQLFRYHRQDKKFRFLNFRTIDEYDELNKLFFQVLAKKEPDRAEIISEKYGHIPYLNSSLFDVSALEHETTRISGLDDKAEIPVYFRSVLTGLRGNTLSTLDYLFRFLDAYDFSAEGSEEIRQERKTLINASVLGLIFEKINGYKDGSFYTPGFITEHMARETLRKAVVDRFRQYLDNSSGKSPLEKGAGGLTCHGAVPPSPGHVEEPGWMLPESLVAAARDLRKNQTEAEEFLWKLLRNKKLYGYKFRRQHPIKPGFVLDFYCAKEKLAIELDGGVHDREDQKAVDEERTQVLNEKDIRVMRFRNEEVLENTDFVLKRIAEELGVYAPSPQTPLPPAGEGLKGTDSETSSLNKNNAMTPSPAGGRGTSRPTPGPGEGGFPSGENSLTLTDIYNHIGRDISIAQANALINSITICDPAVGSGHFLVSCLNELLAIKSELGILCDAERKVLRDVTVTVENDELIVTWGDGELFEYDVKHAWKGTRLASRKINPERQRIQQTLFNEKRYLIENCLFGVDINLNSVKICRLRLWIELLKHAYYTLTPGPSPARWRGAGGEGGPASEPPFMQLQTLPNIDINIKQGNSLVSRFELDSDLGSILEKTEYTLEEYRKNVADYKETRDRAAKKELWKAIEAMKESFAVELRQLHPERQKLKELQAGLIKEKAQQDFFDDELEGGGSRQMKVARLEQEMAVQQQIVDDLEAGAFYRQAFEWRFEFPEVLDAEGRFTGFDVVIGNPPYIRQEALGEFKEYLEKNYKVYRGTADIYTYFYELGHRLLGNGGWFSMITSNKFMRTNYGEPLRNYLSDDLTITRIIDFGELPVFDEAATFPCIFLTRNQKIDEQAFEFFQVKELDPPEFPAMVEEGVKILDNRSIEGSNWSLADPIELNIIEKMRDKGIELEKFVKEEIKYGIKTGYNKAFVINHELRDELINEDSKSAEIIKPVLKGNDIRFYSILFQDIYLIVTKTDVQIEKYPAIKKHLDQYKDKLTKRYDKGNYYWELRTCDYYEEFEKSKIIYPDIAKESRFTLDTEGYYLTNTSYFIPSSDKCVLGILNSKLVFNYYKRVSSVLGDADKGGRMRWFRQDVSKIPIADPDKKTRKQIESLVGQILTAKRDDPDADTSKPEAEIDRLVYELYGLSEEEVGIVEGSVG